MLPFIRSLCLVSIVTALAAPLPVKAQLIPIKTTPIVSGDSGIMLPSRTLGMGGVSIAVDNPLLDPFVNPAKGARLEGLQLFALPTLYSIDDEQGSGRTLTGGVTIGTPHWFAGGFLSTQRLVNTLPTIPWFEGLTVQQLQETKRYRSYPSPLPAPSMPRNITWQVFTGIPLSDRGPALGLSWSGSDTERLEGYEYLYRDCLHLKHSGRSNLVRIGIFSEEEETGSAEVMILLGASNLVHRVIHPDLRLGYYYSAYNPWIEWNWWPVAGYKWDGFLNYPAPVQIRRFEDRSRTLGFHIGGIRKFQGEFRTLGWHLTWNGKKYPKIPEYELEGMKAIPRDPGYVHAFSLGLGTSGLADGITWSWEFTLQPIFLETWGLTEDPFRNWQGAEILPAGAKTVENRFRFLNGSMALGCAWEREPGGLQFGARLTSYNYTIRQKDNRWDSVEKREENWLELTPTWGGYLTFPDFRLQYSGYIRFGTGRPGVERFWIDPRNPMGSEGSLVINPSDPLAAPTGKVVLEPHPVLCHQVALIVPVKF